MPLNVVTPSTVPLITLEEAKAQTRVTHAHEDDLLNAAIGTAREWIERLTWRQLLQTTLMLRLDRFPAGRVIYLPRPRLVSVTSVEYLSGGSWATLSAGRYGVDSAGEPGRVRVDDGGWPSTDDALNAVRITYVAGYGSATSDVPEPIRWAAKLLVSAFYNFRSMIPDDTQRAVDNLISPYCVRGLDEIPYLIGTNEALKSMEDAA